MHNLRWIAAMIVVTIGLGLGLYFIDVNERKDSEQARDQRRGESIRSSEVLSARDEPADAGGDVEATRSMSEGDDQVGADLQWDRINDVDGMVRSLRQEMDAGNPQAGWRLYQLAFMCLRASIVPEQIADEMQTTMQPDRRAELQAELERLEQMEGPCQDSLFQDPMEARSVYRDALWKSAQAGHLEAKYKLVFTSYMPGNEPVPSDADEDIDWTGTRREMLSDLRNACHNQALHSIGVHLARDSEVADELVRDRLPGHDVSTSRQIQAFSHRYAAAQLRDETQPAHSARNPDFPLTGC